MISAKASARSSTISAVITRANGSVEDLGVISYWHKNKFKRWTVNAFLSIKRRLKW